MDKILSFWLFAKKMQHKPNILAMHSLLKLTFDQNFLDLTQFIVKEGLIFETSQIPSLMRTLIKCYKKFKFELLTYLFFSKRVARNAYDIENCLLSGITCSNSVFSTPLHSIKHYITFHEGLIMCSINDKCDAADLSLENLIVHVQ